MEQTYDITPEPADDERKVIVLALERERRAALGRRPDARKWRRGPGWEQVVARDWEEAVRGIDAPDVGAAG